MKYLLQLVVLLSVFLTSMLSTAAIHDGAVEIRSENGSQVIGYVHEFLPFDLNVRQDTPIVFIPGFDIPGLGDNERELPPGERDKGFRLLRSLSQSNELFDEEPERAIELLADQHGFRVFVVESVDNNQSVAKNSLIVERYLTAGETGPFQTYMRNGTRGVVIGFSMGGIIARHALTKLEFENRDHHTSLYVSMDAPHRGAFLPSSLELVTRTLNGAAQKKIIGEIFKGENLDQRLEDGVEALNSEAARELLGLYIGFRAEDFQTPARLQAIEADYMQAAHPSHHTLRNSILLMGGHPTSLRSVAFANGSINGFPLHNREAQGRQDGFLMLNVPIKFNSPTAPDEELISIKFFNDATLQRRTPCRVRVLADTDRCPNFRLPSELHDVTAAPGSFTTGLREVDETIDSTADITVPFDIRLVLDTITLSLATLNPVTGFAIAASKNMVDTWLADFFGFETTISFAAHMTAGEGLTTFVPTISALDINSLDWHASANELTNLSPFDQLYANFDRNAQHDVVTDPLFADLVEEVTKTESTRVRNRNRLAAVIGSF